MSHLPCKKCGNSLPIVKGALVQCPYCGAKNFYMESFYTFKYFMSDILKLSSFKNGKKTNSKEIERRKILLKDYFNNISAGFNEYRHLIITKLDKIDIDPIKLFYLIRASGNFEIIIDKFLLPYLTEEKADRQYFKLRDLSYIINKSLLGLYYSYLAKIISHSDKCFKLYKYANKNYQNVVDYCNIIELESNGIEISKKREIFSILADFSTILGNILYENPTHFSAKLEELLKKLRKVKIKGIQIYNLYNQVEHIYELERNTSILLENIRADDPFSLADPIIKQKFSTSKEDLDKLNRIRDWINDVSNKYQNYQKSLLKLHSGRIMKYLGSYREEFFNYKNKTAKKFDDLLGNMINKALEDYNSETLEALNTVSNLMHKNIYNTNLIETLKIGHDELIEMDELLKKFADNLFKKPLLRNLESEYYKKLLSLISGKHSEFDKYILKSIHRILNNFEEFRKNEVVSIRDQRKQFVSEIKPNLQKLIDLSFTLNEEILPYPLFIDIEIQNQKLRLNNPEIITFTIENPNSIDIKNIKIYFFVPESFHNKQNFTAIKKLKAYERRKIKARIIPKQKGTFPSVVMIEYQHFNKTFWMPSIKFKLVVEKTRKHIPLHVISREVYQSELQNARILNVLRGLV
ncbi:MAG: hypothetical protein ACW96S_11105 [Promethearchaeota archaeon]|jgi:DNA-directed RNA polymerase subunit RPC12/RpoP